MPRWVGVVAVGDEAQVLALGLVPQREPEPRAVGAHLALLEVPERELGARQRRVGHQRQRVGLVLGGVGGAVEPDAAVVVGAHPRVVPGHEPLGADQLHAPDQVAELEVLVAQRARIGGAAARVVVEERLEHAGAKHLLGLDHEVREAHAPRHRLRVADRVERAAGALAHR